MIMLLGCNTLYRIMIIICMVACYIFSKLRQIHRHVGSNRLVSMYQKLHIVRNKFSNCSEKLGIPCFSYEQITTDEK